MIGGNVEKLTTAQAQERTGASRFALNRAVKSGALHPIRDNRGALLWDAEELDLWAGVRGAQRAAPATAQLSAQDTAHPAQAEIEALRDRLTQAESRAAQAEARATEAETRAAVAEARAEGAERLAAERIERIDDLRRMLDRPRRGWWPFG